MNYNQDDWYEIDQSGKIIRNDQPSYYKFQVAPIILANKNVVIKGRKVEEYLKGKE